MKAEITVLIRMLTRWLLQVVLLTIFMFSATIAPYDILGYTLWLPAVTDTSLASLIFIHLSKALTPSGVDLVVISPSAAFAAQVLVAFWLALLVSLPFLLWGLLRYLAPALRTTERRGLWYATGALTTLIAAGVYFSYAVVSPYTIKVLYTFTTPLGVTPLLGVSELIATFAALTLVTSTMFTVPVGMVLLTRIGLLEASWWRENARYAVLGFLIISAIITPDGTGVSMLLLSAPVTVLYGVGMIISTRVEQRTV